MALGERKRRKRLCRRVLAAERLEARIVERLHAERQPVDAGRAVAGEVLGLDAGGIGFERDLGIARRARQWPAMASRIAATVAGCISDGVPPPKKMLVTLRPGASEAKCASSAR